MIMLLLFILAAILAGLLAVYIRFARGGSAPATWRTAERDQQEVARLLARAARLLEAGLRDPMYRQSDDWSTVAQQIVDDYYEGD